MKYLIILVAFLCALCGQLTAAESPKLNLLYITADDMNADSPGWMGSTMGATPVLDAFAATCHRFINNHVTAPICQPSRSAIMTGRVPHRSGALGFHPIKPGTPTLTSVLKAAGYFAGVIDKHPHMKPDAEFPWDIKLSGSGKNPPLMREHMDQLLKAAADAKKPFFINANITDPHRPFPSSPGSGEAEETTPKTKAGKKNGKKAVKAEAAGKSLPRVYTAEEITVPDFLENIPPVRKEVAQYYTAIARLNLTFSNIIAALKENGHADDTVILFMSDHGMSFPFSKATVYYNGTRSPVILKWPGMPAAATHEEFVSSVDILPTLLDLLAVKHPDGMDGRSWVPLLRGEKQAARDYVITHVNTVSSGMGLPQRCIRTKDWALMFHAWPDGSAKFKVEAMSGITYQALETAAKTDERIASRVKQLRVGEPLMFFNELTDPSERNNTIGDANYAPEIKRLAALLLSHMEKTGDPQTANFKKAFETWNAK